MFKPGYFHLYLNLFAIMEMQSNLPFLNNTLTQLQKSQK